jgi:amino acid transporter
VLEIGAHALRVRCFPKDLPPVIEVDVTELKVGETLKVGTPVRALVVQFFAASILVLSGRFEDLVTLTSLAMMLLGSLSVIGLFRLLRRPGQDRTGLVLIGFPWLPIAYLAASLIVVVSSLYQSTTNTEAGLAQRLLPMLGLLLFVGAWIGHALLERLRARAASKA